ncbi:uncharacterized protein LOC124284623 isoform X2 [Haliotis rubra]|uniref:uncharacterized protein LOC124284623 isoform X2 n=1 Tax=Haliotis rubra TaxID=36100 RepID=UPI001EE630D8|nr:uncharacterized protein LOC124284623 isoform X2 [Haliotis rubra]
MASNNYECSICDIIGSKEKLTEHFIRTHVSLDKVPWICSLCGFKAVSRLQCSNHVGHFRHKKALERNPGGKTEYRRSQSPYEVQVGRDIFLYREDEPVYRHGVDKVIDYNHRSVGMVVGNRSKEGGGSTIERRKTVEDREGKGGERKGKLDSREENGGEGREILEDREGKGGGRKRKSEEREGSTIERRNISGNGEQNGEKRRQKHRTSEPDKLQKKPKLTSSRGKDSNTLTKLDRPVSDTHQNLRRENGHVVTNDSGAKEKATTFFTERTEEPAMSFSSEQGYNLASEPEESAEVKVEPDIDTEGQTSRSGIEGESEVRAPWEEGALVEKITELTQSLEPLKNISKALIALDHHMRRLLPLVNQILTGPPSSTAGLGAVRK